MHVRTVGILGHLAYFPPRIFYHIISGKLEHTHKTMFWSSISLTPTAIASAPFPLTELFFPPLSPTPTPATVKLRSSSTYRCTKTDLTSQHEETPPNPYPKQDETPQAAAAAAAAEEENFQVLTAIHTQYNDILIVDTPQSRMLLLDSTRTLFLFLFVSNICY